MELVEAIKINLEKKGHLDKIRNDIRLEISHCFRSGLQGINLINNNESKQADRFLQSEVIQASLEKKGQMDKMRAKLRSKVLSCFQSGMNE
jgi:hypothetical protein